MYCNFSAPVITAEKTDSVLDVLTKMQTEFVRHVVIVKDNDHPIGIITQKDVLKLIQDDPTKRTLDLIKAGEIMKKDLFTVRYNDQYFLEVCADMMDNFGVGSVVVINDKKRLSGITTRTELINAYSHLFKGKARICLYMKTKIITCRFNDTLEFAFHIMQQHHVSHLIVTDSSGYPHGILSLNDVLKHSTQVKYGIESDKNAVSSGRKKKKMTVQDVAKTTVIVAHPDDDLTHATEIMTRNKISAVPVIENGHFVGIVTKSNVISAFTKVKLHERLAKKYAYLH